MGMPKDPPETTKQRRLERADIESAIRTTRKEQNALTQSAQDIVMGTESSNQNDTRPVRDTKLKDFLDFDREKNKRWYTVLQRARRTISRLCTELHILSTLSAQRKQPGRRMIAQTQERKRCLEAVQRCKQAIREALRECEVADGHTGIPGNAFDSEGEIDQADIACSACDDPECDDENDILLCDGEGCNRAYHVTCLPVKDTFDPEKIPEEEGWLCPACDCRYDILFELHEAFPEEFPDDGATMKLRWSDVLSEDSLVEDFIHSAGMTILDADLPSDDESDQDFGENDSDMAAVPCSNAASARGKIAKTSAESNGHGEEGQDIDADGTSESSDYDSDEYQSDDLSEGRGAGGAQERADLLRTLEQEAEMDPGELIVLGKRARSKVDYTALNASLFGDAECYEGEGVDAEFCMGRTRAVESPVGEEANGSKSSGKVAGRHHRKRGRSVVS